ncbi:hypothetical protein, partial [Actinacidiphila soli]|uniref:hypothetical protein n=1 Tax=Actinacidiphila soli TaxID=2487275 RepID=UPI000FC99E8E
MNARSGTIALAALAFGGVALVTAAPAFAAPGDKGVVDIREVGSTTATTPATTPAAPPAATPATPATPAAPAAPAQGGDTRVCHFYLDASGFETVSQANWQITPAPAQAGGPTRSGSISLTAGAGVTAAVAPQLPDGTYKLSWSFQGQEMAGKEKTFRVACPATADEQAGAVQAASTDQAQANGTGTNADWGSDGSDGGDGGGGDGGGSDDGGRADSGGSDDWGSDQGGRDDWGGNNDNWGDSGYSSRAHHQIAYWPQAGPRTGLGGSVAAASTGEIAAGAALAAGAAAG